MADPVSTGIQRVPAARVNLIANYVGRISNAACSILAIPLYLRFLGIEAYGLVGFYTSLIGVLGILDMGMSATITRELSTAGVSEENARRSRNLVRALGFVYWLIAAIVAVSVGLGAGTLARDWLKVGRLPLVTVEHAIMLMGLTLGGQMLLGFYSAGLYGLQRHVTCNVILTCVALLRSVGAVLVLWLVSSTITVFYICQMISMVAGLAAAFVAVHRYMPKGPTHADWAELRHVWRFAAGAFTVSITAMLLYQTDKIALSRMLLLKQFGYYAFAVSAASILTYISSPVFTTYFPAFSRKVALNDDRGFVDQYHRASQLLAVATIPAGAILIFFPTPLIIAWTGNTDIASHTATLVTLLGVGMIFNSIAPLTYAAQWAHGWTRLSAAGYLLMFLLLVVLLLLVVPHYGAEGAAASWLLVNALYVAGTVWFMHRRILRGEAVRWYIRDMLPSAATAALLVGGASMLVRFDASRALSFTKLAAIYAVLLASAALATNETRSYAFRLLRHSGAGAIWPAATGSGLKTAAFRLANWIRPK